MWIVQAFARRLTATAIRFFALLGLHRSAYIILLHGLLFALPVQADASSTTRPGSVAFWYASSPPLEELAQFEWAVLESGHLSRRDVAFLRAQGSSPFAYLSVGEYDGNLAEGGDEIARSASEIRNQAWNSQVMQLSAPAWREHLLAQARALEQQGYVGLFLDTLDSFLLLPEDRREAERVALRDFLWQLHRELPELKLIFNRGFEVLPELPGVASAVAVESIHAGWDAGRGRYRTVPQADRDWLDIHLDPLRAQGVPLIAIDYLPSTQREEARALAERLRGEGFIPFVTMPELNYLGVSTLEVQPRRVAVVYDPREGPLSSNRGHMFLGGLIEYLGYRVDYLPADQLPESPMGGSMPVW